MEVVVTGDARTVEDSFDEPGEIVTALLHAAGFVRQRLGEFLERYELSEGRYAVLETLGRSGFQGLSQSEVAEQLLQSESNISSLIERLHRDGLVDRRWSDTDRRKRVLQLTADGRRLIEKVRGAHRSWAESLLSSVAPYERRALSQGLKRVHQSRNDVLEQSASSVIAESVIRETIWPDRTVIVGRDTNSPHFALEQMLSTLGVAGRFAEEEQ